MHRAFFLAFVLYVTLDLALPEMPGAFVFDPDQSVEGAEPSRVRVATGAVALPLLARNEFVPSALPVDIRDRAKPSCDVAGREHPGGRWLPRASLSAPSVSDEAH